MTDYIKATYPLVYSYSLYMCTSLILGIQAFTLTSICWSAISFGQGKFDTRPPRACQIVIQFSKGYDNSNQTAYLDSMLRWGLDWLIKARYFKPLHYVV